MTRLLHSCKGEQSQGRRLTTDPFAQGIFLAIELVVTQQPLVVKTCGPKGAPRCVLLHGFTGAAASWDAVVARLGALNIVRLHLPGHHPQAPVAASFAANVEAVHQTLVEHHALPAHLVGYSLGARLAAGLAVFHPQSFVSVTLLGGHPGLELETERQTRRAADRHWIQLLRQRGIAEFVDAWEQRSIFSTQNQLDDVARQQRFIRLQHHPESLARVLETMGLGEMPNYRPRLAALALPVTVVAGRQDARFMALNESLMAAASHIEGRVVDGGHNLPLEAPRAVADVICDACQP